MNQIRVNNISCLLLLLLLLFIIIIIIIDPIIISAVSIIVTATAWNYNGSILAIGGSQTDKEISIVQFFTNTGQVNRLL